MTIANKITLSRIALIPVSLILLFVPSLQAEIRGFFQITIAQLVFLLLFCIASFTDFLDGYLARKRGEVTTFGKFLDPIADKILVFTALIFLPVFPFWQTQFRMEILGIRLFLLLYLVSVLLILTREFLVTAARLVAVGENKVVAAAWLGKVKTAFTLVALIWLLFNGFGLDNMLFSYFPIISFSLILISVILTIWSGLQYIWQLRAEITKSV